MIHYIYMIHISYLTAIFKIFDVPTRCSFCKQDRINGKFALDNNLTWLRGAAARGTRLTSFETSTLDKIINDQRDRCLWKISRNIVSKKCLHIKKLTFKILHFAPWIRALKSAWVTLHLNPMLGLYRWVLWTKYKHLNDFGIWPF